MIDQPVFLALVIMSLLTTIVVPLVLRNWLYRQVEDSEGESVSPSRRISGKK